MQTYDTDQKVLVHTGDGTWRPGAVVKDEGNPLVEVRVAFPNNSIRFWVSRDNIADPLKSTYGKNGLAELPTIERRPSANPFDGPPPAILPRKGPHRAAPSNPESEFLDDWQLIAEAVAMKHTHGEAVARRLLFAIVDTMRGNN